VLDPLTRDEGLKLWIAELASTSRGLGERDSGLSGSTVCEQDSRAGQLAARRAPRRPAGRFVETKRQVGMPRFVTGPERQPAALVVWREVDERAKDRSGVVNPPFGEQEVAGGVQGIDGAARRRGPKRANTAKHRAAHLSRHYRPMVDRGCVRS
jgi:hypothetical protein